VPNILILIPSFDNKHIINAIVYIRFDIYVQFEKKGKRRMSRVYLEEDNVSILEV